MQNIKYLRFLLVVFISALAARYALNLNLLPTGYLHSWNQITTLIWIDDISDSFDNWNYQRDAIARVTSHAQDRFRIFEEFPLYSIIAGTTAQFLGSSIVSARLISILCLGLSAYILYLTGSLFKSKSLGMLMSCLLLSSSPFIYYGQAVMSDLLMSLCILIGYFYTEKATRTNSKIDFYFSFIFFALSGLSKSYGIIFSIIALTPLLKNTKTIQRYFKGIITLIVISLPTLFWHIWCLYQDGNQEIYSHSILDKASIIFNFKFIALLVVRLVSYYGVFTYILPISFLYFYYTKKYLPSLLNKSKSLGFILTSIILYLIITADKLPAHDYYFLPVCILLIPTLAMCIEDYVERFDLRKRILIDKIIIVCLIVNFCFSYGRLIKASKENYDVYACAQEIKNQTAADDIITFWTDVSRYNSIAYVAKRKGFAFEEGQIPLQKYIDNKSQYLLINLPSEESDKIHTFTLKAKDKLSEIAAHTYHDFKNRTRICNLYKLNAR